MSIIKKHRRPGLAGRARAAPGVIVPSGAECHRQELDWNETTRDYPRDACVHEVFEARAREAPESVALVDGSRVLTYGELDRRSNQLARRLGQLGVGPEALVGVFLERSLESVVAILAVLKAGGAYVPLDPSHPRGALAFQLEDTRAPVLLTRSALRPLLPPHTSALVCVDAEWPSIAAYDPGPPPRLGSAEGLACVMYTSGSTGRPKGVMVTHRGVVRLLFGIDYVRLGRDAVVLHLAPLSFDASTLEIWAPLLHGGRCVIAPDRLPSARELGRILREGQVNTLWLTAALYNVVIDEAPEALSGLDQLLIGGEALSVAHVRRGLERLPKTQLVNGYGPTEGTTFTCCFPIPRPLEDEAVSVPIGGPIGNTRVYLLDGAMRPVRAGAVGELYIGGDGVARGYLNRPRLTAEAFVPDPFSPVPGSRLYRSGDLARRRPDGLLEFLGRSDDQVKVRGFRIEPGAIEAALVRCPGVARAVVVTREDTPGDRRLVAYVTASPGSPDPEESHLRTHLEGCLPEFMVPSGFVTLGALPLTANGKVDRRALPAPDPTGQRQRAPYVAPHNEVEATLASAWEEVLGVSPVGVRDDFFRLGGDSLLGLRLLARVEEACGVRLPPQALLHASTVERLAVVVSGLARGEVPGGSSLVAIRAVGPRTPFFFLAGGTAVLDGRGLMYLHRLTELLGPGRPVYTFVGGDLDWGVPTDRLVEQLASSFVDDLCAAFPDGPYHLGGHSFGAFLALEMARQLLELGRPVGPVGMLDPLSPLYPRKLSWWERPGRRVATQLVESVGGVRRRFGRPSVPTTPDVPEADVERRLGLLKQSVARYTSATRPYPGRVTLFRPTGVPPGFSGFSFDDPCNGLAPLVDGRIEVCRVPGNHSTMVWEEGLRVIADGIESGLRG